MGCTEYAQLCAVNGTVVKDCDIDVIPLPSESQVTLVLLLC